MTYRVIISRAVIDAIDARVTQLVEEAGPSDRIDRWLSGLLDLIDSLYEWPRRYPVAEAVSEAAGYDVRRANYSDYAVFYRVDDGRGLVEVIAFRHGRQRPGLEEDAGGL